VPQRQLPQGCQLAPARSWGGLRIASNPWTGADAPLAGKIRLLVEGAPRAVDGPPSRAALAQQELKLAEDVEEAYAAFYTAPGDGLVAVFAVKLKPSKRPIEGASRRRDPMRVGSFLVAHSGRGDECHEAVVKHLSSLGGPAIW
jgi:hypothetical protein